MKKTIYVLALMLLSISCGYSNDHKKEEELKQMNVRFNNLIYDGLGSFHKDTLKLIQAISLSDSILKEDTVTNRRIKIFQSRSTVFMQLGQKENALTAMENAMLLLPKDNINRLIFMIHKNKYLHKTDSAYYYSNLALQNCDNNLTKGFNANWVLKKVEVIYQKSGEQTAKKYILAEYKKHSKDKTLKYAIEEWENLSILLSKSPFAITQKDMDEIQGY